MVVFFHMNTPWCFLISGLFNCIVLAGPLNLPGLFRHEGCPEQGQALLDGLFVSKGSHGTQEPGRADQRTDHQGWV